MERAAASAVPRGGLRLRRLLRFVLLAALLLALLPVPLLLLYRVVPAPLTPLMLIRAVEGEGLEKSWRPYEAVSPNLFRAVIAAEDARFCEHHGFDWRALRQAWEAYGSGDRVLGASTISMQTAKNLFLWPDRTFIRKGAEAYITVLLELFWSKRRILETYVNIVEWGHGIYGAEAAARAHFGKSARALTPREAALLAAVLPNPRRWSAGRPTAYIGRRAATILGRMDDVELRRGEACPSDS